MKYEFYQNEKVIVWLNTKFTIEASSQEEAEKLLKLSRNKTISDRMNDKKCPIDIENTEVLFSTQEHLSVAENNDKATIAVYRNQRGFHEDVVCTNDTKPLLLNIVPPEIPEHLKSRKAFIFGGLQFIPVCRFSDLTCCESLHDISQHISSIKEGGPFSFSKYNYGQSWDYNTFISCEKNSITDIYYCIEAGDYFCPGQNELFRFNHPDLKK